MFTGLHAHVRECAAVAAGAISNKGGVINSSRSPRGLRMTGTALCRSRYVRCRILTRRQCTVVALVARGNAGLRMIERCDRLPLARRLGMASIASIAGA